MGLLDIIKGIFGGNASSTQTQAEPEPEVEEASEAAFDLAGFDPRNENDFFEAVLLIESEGVGGGSEASRAQTMARFRIANHEHWQVVKESMYRTLAQHYGSIEAVMQQEMNYRQRQMTNRMQGNIAAQAANGQMAPVEGISLESWAAINAAIAQGANPGDLLRGGGIDMARWDRARTEWEARMSRDTTFAIATVYGQAFQNATTGRFSSLAREANAARTASQELSSPLPMPLQQYFDIMFEQSFGCAQGKDAASVLREVGLSVVDWCDLSTFMGYYFERTAGYRSREYSELVTNTRNRFQAKYAGVRADVDIAF